MFMGANTEHISKLIDVIENTGNLPILIRIPIDQFVESHSKNLRLSFRMKRSQLYHNDSNKSYSSTGSVTTAHPAQDARVGQEFNREGHSRYSEPLHALLEISETPTRP